MTPETTFKNQVQKYLKSINSYQVKQHGNMYSRVGVPDLLVCLRGLFIGIELKSEKGKPTAEQLNELNKIIEAGGIAILLYPKDFQAFKLFCDRLGD